MIKKYYITLVILFLCIFMNAQKRFVFPDGVKKSEVKFQLINNLVIIPVEVNGVALTFLLDTGASKTIAFNLRETEMFRNRSSQEVSLKGISGDRTVTAYKAISNLVKIGNAAHYNLDIFLIQDKELNFFPRLGIPIHGIIGKDFFEDFVVEVFYSKKKIKFYNHHSYPEKRMKKYRVSDLKILSGKPHFEVSVKSNEQEHVDLNLLIDTGMSDALWLIDDNNLQKPRKKFHDFLGRSITGNVFGDRAKMEEVAINSFKFNNVVSAFPDSTSTKIPNVVNGYRNGVVGGEILKRFNCVLDYKNKRLGLRRNVNYTSKFYYNVSGLELYYDGYSLFKRYRSRDSEDDNDQLVLLSRIEVVLKPTVKILNVRRGSPADKIGIQNDDILVAINNADASNYDLTELIQKINDFEAGKKIKLKIERAGNLIEYEFYPKDIL